MATRATNISVVSFMAFFNSMGLPGFRGFFFTTIFIGTITLQLVHRQNLADIIYT